MVKCAKFDSLLSPPHQNARSIHYYSIFTILKKLQQMVSSYKPTTDLICSYSTIQVLLVMVQRLLKVRIVSDCS